MLAVGDECPDFTLPLATPEGRSTFTLREHLGEGDLVFSFFPLAFSGVCTEQMCDARDRHADLDGLGARLFGFSVDSMPANVAFIKRYRLKHPIVSDANREVAPRIWELDPEAVVGVRNTTRRGVLVLDREGVVKYRWVAPDPEAKPPFEEIVKHVEAPARE